MTQDKQRKSSKILLEEKHMKNYFRSLKRSKSKGAINQKIVGKNKNMGMTKTSEAAKENKVHKIRKPRTKDVVQLKNSEKSCNEHEEAAPAMSDVSSDTEFNHSVDTIEAEVDDFTDTSFWKEPFIEVDLDNMSGNVSEEDNVKVTKKEMTSLGQSEGQFNAAAFWKDPMPDIDLSDFAESITVDQCSIRKSATKHKPQELDEEQVENLKEGNNKKTVDENTEDTDDQFNSSEFWKDPIPDINVSDLINIGKANVEANELRLIQPEENIKEGAMTDKNIAMGGVFVNPHDNMSEKLEELEDDNKSLRTYLANLRNDIMTLAARINALEA